MTQKDLTLFFVWCWFQLWKKREYRRRTYEKHKVRDLAYSREYHQKNPEKIKEINRRYGQLHQPELTNRMREWRGGNLERSRANQRAWYSKNWNPDSNWRIRVGLSNRINDALRWKVSKSARTLALVGCDIPSLKKHLSAQFRPGMSWENYGEWHIDHIRPCASFDLTDPEQQRQCFNFKNLQPLWAKENLSKGAKYSAA